MRNLKKRYREDLVLNFLWPFNMRLANIFGTDRDRDPIDSDYLYLGVFITSYSLRDIGTAFFLWKLEGPNPNERRFKKRYFTCWNIVNITMDILFLIGLIIRSLEYMLGKLSILIA